MKKKLIISFLLIFITTVNANEKTRYDSNNKNLYLPNVEVPNFGNYHVVMNLVETSPDLIFELSSARKRGGVLNNTEYFSFDSGFLVIPIVDVFSKQWSALLELIKGSDPLRFKILDAGETPPDPGEKGKATLQGIDSDNDGIRDDIQLYINKTYIKRPTLRYYLEGNYSEPLTVGNLGTAFPVRRL